MNGLGYTPICSSAAQKTYKKTAYGITAPFFRRIDF